MRYSGAVPRRGLFIVLEGIDGCGKTEQVGRLVAWLREQGYEVVQTCEPTGGPWGRRFRAWARGETEASPEQVLEYFIEDRREHVAEVIEPALRRGAVIVCDRYVASTLAYQAAHGVPRETLRARMADEGFPEPDGVFWLRIAPDRALARKGANAGERFERAPFLARVDHEYAALDLESIDATGTVEEVAAALRIRVAPLLARAGGDP